MLVRSLLVAIAASISFCSVAFAKGNFCGVVFGMVQQEAHTAEQLKRMDFVVANEVTNIFNHGLLTESIAALMRKPSNFEATSFETAKNKAVLFYHESKVTRLPEATVFVLADSKNESTYTEVLRDVMGLHDRVFAESVRQLNFYVPIERGDLAQNIVDAAKENGFSTTSIESNPDKIRMGLLPGQTEPVDEFYDLIEIQTKTTPGNPISGDFYIVTVYLDK